MNNNFAIQERTIRNIVALGGKIYVNFPSLENCAKFLHMAENEGFQTSANGKPTEMHLTNWVRVYLDGTLSYVQTNGRQLIQSGMKISEGLTVHRIDFEKYLRGDDDYNWYPAWHNK